MTNINTFQGQVGIGTNNPVATLDVAGSATDGKSLQLRSGDVNDGTDSAQIIFSHSGNPYNSGGYAHSIRTRHQSGGDGQNAIDFWCWNTTDTTDGDTLGNKRVMTIEGTGNVGIGTNSPKTRLNITSVSSKDDNMTSLRSNAAIRVDTAGDLNDFLSIGIFDTDTPDDNNPTGYIQHSWDSNSDGGRAFVINPVGGYVGIGTSVPDKPLHVFSAAGAGNTQLHIESGDRYASMQLLDTGGGILMQNDQGDFRFLTGYNTAMQSGEEALRIDGNQNTQIAGSLFMTTQNELINFNVTGQSTGIRWGAVGGTTVSKIIDHGNLNICTDDNMSFRIGNITGTNLATEFMNIDGDGVVIPAGTFSVRSGSDVTVDLGIAKLGYIGHGNYAGFSHYQRANQGDYAMIQEATGTTFLNAAPGADIIFRNNNGDKCIMKNTGRWGFGTTQPLAPVDVANSVSGTVEINNNQTMRILNWAQAGDSAQNNDAGGVSVSINGDGGNITAHGFYAGYGIQFQSDKRIKKDITEIQDDVALQKFRLLKPSKYKYIEPILSGRTQRDVFGFIAQEVQEVMPEAVTEGIAEGTCQGHIPNIMTLCTVDEQHITPEAYDNLTTEQKAEYFYSDQNEVDVGEEMANSYIREVITFSNTFDLSVITDNSYTASTTTKTTGDFEQDPETGEYWPVIFYDKNKVTSKRSIIKIIDSSSFIVNERLNTNTLIDGSEVLCYGQQPSDFCRLNKDAIFTVTTAALQEIDRQQLSDKVRIATLESQYSNLLTRVTVLENA